MGIDINSLPSNSKKDKERKTNYVYSGEVVQMPKSFMQRFAELFFAGAEDPRTIRTYIIEEVIVPNIKETFMDIVSNVLDMVLRTDRHRGDSYNKMYKGPSASSPSINSDNRQAVQKKSVNNLVFENRWAAEEVLNEMGKVLNTYPVISVADLYELLGQASDYTDNKYGWKTLNGAYIQRGRGGYKLCLPNPVRLD